MSSSPDLLARVRARLPAGAGRICVAFSGGLDSTVLLDILARMRCTDGLSVSVLHVHHGLNSRADDWAAHCLGVATALGLACRIARVEVSRDEGKGLEAAARAARHAEFAAEGADWVALAHHADDQAETLLHRLVRGTGLQGAGAMRGLDPARRLWRPLLECGRAELEVWAAQHGLRWIEDDSNRDPGFFRNFLRHEVLAPLNTRFPAASRNLARAAAHFAEGAELLAALGEIDAEAVWRDGQNDRQAFRALAPARQRNLLRFWLQRAGELFPDSRRTDSLCAALAGPGGVREACGGLALCAWRERIWFEPAVLACPQDTFWQGEEALPWGAGQICCVRGEGGVRLATEPPAAEPVFRVRAGGERMRLAAGRPTRSLRQLCQEAAVPPWWRDVMPMLWQGERLLWVGGVGAAAPSDEGEPWRIVWQGPDGIARG